MSIINIIRNIYFVHDDGSAELLCGDSHILLDASDVDKVSQYQWSVGTHGYATSGCGQNQLLLHRIIAKAKTGETVDHINRNKLDNRRANLRICAIQQNAMNKGKIADHNPYKGVCRLPDGKWRAQIQHNKRSIYLGTFSDVCDAAKAYDAAARDLFGEYACLNFPDCNEQPKITINHRTVLTYDEAKSIRDLFKRGMSISELAKMYGHSYSAIQRIVHHRTFKEETGYEKVRNRS